MRFIGMGSISLMTLGLVFFGASCAEAQVASGDLIKGNLPAVYYIGNDGKRYIFPNTTTYASWYGNSYGAVKTVSAAELASYPLGKNVTIRPGAYLIKITTDPKVYAVAAGGRLRWVKTEAIAKALYGSGWNKKVVDVPDTFFLDYTIDTPIDAAAAYDANSAMNFVPDIQTNLDSRDNYNSDQWMTASQKKVMNALTDLFEVGTQQASYSIVEALDDGRGITSGRAGFTTATGDANMVVQRYTTLRANNPLAKYLPELQRLADEESGDTSGLKGYADAWQTAALDPLFMKAQDEVTDELYYKPAMQAADEAGAKTALARAFMYDTIIQHGGGDDPDGLDALLVIAKQKSNGTPSTGVSEAVWLKNFIDTRHADLLNAHDEATSEVWAESAYRTNVYLKLLNDGNLNLQTPISVKEDWIDEMIR